MITIRPGAAEDLAAIALIQGASREASQWRAEEYLLYSVRVAEQDHTIAGFIVTRLVSHGEYEVLNLAVDPEYRRKGIGRTLLQAAMENSPGVYYLEVRESNRVARSFYGRLGFAEVGVRRNYYTEPDEAGIVMRICS